MKNTKFEVYLDAAQEWRWRLKARNGEIVAVSGEGFSSQRKAIEGTQVVRSISTDALLEVLLPEEPAEEKKGEVARKLERLRAATPAPAPKPDRRPQPEPRSALVKPSEPVGEPIEPDEA